MADMMYGPTTGGDVSEDSAADFGGGGFNNATIRQKFPGLYVGNLTWWTTDQDVINAINSVGVNDVQEVKFFENRNNGQSKGFCVVTFNTEASLPTIMEKLPKLELHGQNPVVTPYNRQNLNLFESQTQKRPQINSNNGPNSHAPGIMEINSISGVHASTQGLPYSGAYNQAPGSGLVVGPRGFHGGMRMPMRAPRAMMPRGVLPGAMGNGPMMPGNPMNRMRFMQPQWNNAQNPYNPATRLPHVNMDISNRLGMSTKSDDPNNDQEMISSNSGSQNYYASHHMSSQSDHYRGGDRGRRDERLPRREEDRTSSSRRDEVPSSRRDDGVPSRREEGSSRRDRDDRSARREEKPSRHRSERSHRSSERTRSRSRDRSRSRERKERRDRDRSDRDRDRSGRDRERERDRDRERRERY